MCDNSLSQGRVMDRKMEDSMLTSRKCSKSQSGAVVVEAALLYPVIFAVFFLMIFAGDMYFQKAWIETEVAKASLEGAQELGDPSSGRMRRNASGGTASYPSGGNAYPYRYITDNNSESVEAETKSALQAKISAGKSSIFAFPKSNIQVVAKHEKHLLYSDFSVSASYDFDIPIFKNLVPSGVIKSGVRASSTTSVASMAELVRTADIVDDVTKGLSDFIRSIDSIGGHLKEIFMKIG
jgi:Flp pilus assembly protein TadG